MDNEFTQFQQSDGGSMFDRKMEQQLDDFIQQHVSEGLDDAQILEKFQQSMLGGGSTTKDMKSQHEVEDFEQD